MWGVKKFHNYLFGRDFTLLTDHEPLTSIFHPSKSLPAVTAARLQRYALFLAGFDYTIRYKNTKVGLFYATQFESLPVTAEQVKRETQRDPLLVKVHELVMRQSTTTLLGMANHTLAENPFRFCWAVPRTNVPCHCRCTLEVA